MATARRHSWAALHRTMLTASRLIRLKRSVRTPAGIVPTAPAKAATAAIMPIWKFEMCSARSSCGATEPTVPMSADDSPYTLAKSDRRLAGGPGRPLPARRGAPRR